MLRVVHGNKELWDSVSFITPDLGETAVHLENEKERLTLLFDFIKSPGKARELEYQAEDATTLRIKCINFDEPFPTTVKEIMEIGDFLGRSLFLLFAVSKIGSVGELREVHISIYLGDKIRG